MKSRRKYVLGAPESKKARTPGIMAEFTSRWGRPWCGARKDIVSGLFGCFSAFMWIKQLLEVCLGT